MPGANNNTDIVYFDIRDGFKMRYQQATAPIIIIPEKSAPKMKSLVHTMKLSFPHNTWYTNIFYNSLTWKLT